MFDGVFTADTADEAMSATDHMGDASLMNQAAGSGGNGAGQALFILWLVVLGLYWGAAWLFRGERG